MPSLGPAPKEMHIEPRLSGSGQAIVVLLQNADYPNGLGPHRGAGFSLRRTSVRPWNCISPTLINISSLAVVRNDPGTSSIQVRCGSAGDRPQQGIIHFIEPDGLLWVRLCGLKSALRTLPTAGLPVTGSPAPNQRLPLNPQGRSPPNEDFRQ